MMRSRPCRAASKFGEPHVSGLISVVLGRSVNAERATRLAIAFASAVAGAPPARLCAVCAEFANVTAAGITLMGGDNAGPICVSSPHVRGLEDLQFTVGQGPCRDAFHNAMPVHAPRLDAAASDLWPPFVELAKASGIGAVFAYPLMSKGAKIGVLTLYQSDEGELTQSQHDDTLALSEVVTETLLGLQDAAPVGMLGAGLDDAVAYRAETYQASGMVAAQLQIPASEALVRIRAYAFATDRTLSAVAADIVARRLRIDDDRRQRDERN